MNDIENARKKLFEFQKEDKFKVYAYLNPPVENSTTQTKALIAEKFNKYAETLLVQLEDKSLTEDDFKKTLKQFILEVDQIPLDTVDWEFCRQLIDVMSKLLGMDIVVVE